MRGFPGLLCLYAIAGLICACALSTRSETLPADGSIVMISKGSFLLTEAERPPREGPGWQPVSLPDRWSESRPGIAGNAWYRFEIPAFDEADEPLGIYVPDLNMNAALWLNGELLTACGSFDEPIANCWNHPLYARLRASALADGPSVLHLRLFTYAPHGGLSPILVGPDRLLAPTYQHRLLLQVRAPQAFTVVALLVVLLMIVFWVSSRDTVYSYFALMTGFWATAILNNHVRVPPVSHDAWQWLVHTSFDWMAVAATLLVHRLFGLCRVRTERTVLAFGIAAAVVAALTPRIHFHDVVNVSHALALMIASYAWFSLFWGARHVTQLQTAGFALSIGVIAIGVHDLLIQTGHLPMDEPHLFAFAAPITIISFAIMLTVRFVHTFNRARNLNAILEEEVRRKELELQTNFERMRELERTRIVAAERERIMREVHDGLGSQLVSTLAMAQQAGCDRKDIIDALRSSIDEMRLMIDSLSPMVDDLPTLLGMIRGRIEPRLRKHGLRFEWNVTELPPMPSLGPHELLHVLRIVQEAITNVIKHAQASVITVATRLEANHSADGSVFVSIRDNGIGLSSNERRGHGLRNMELRAREIGAEVSVRGVRRGTCVALRIPL